MEKDKISFRKLTNPLFISVYGGKKICALFSKLSDHFVHNCLTDVTDRDLFCSATVSVCGLWLDSVAVCL